MTDAEIDQLRERAFFIREDFIDRATAAQTANTLASLDRFRPAGVGRQAQRAQAVRSDELCWLDRADAPPLFDAFERLRAELNRDAYLGLTRFDVQLARYPKGASYARHKDALRGTTGRRATAIVYLNPGWQPADGGELRLHTENESTDIEPRLARLVVFLSERLEHEVLPANAPRLAATAWYYAS